MAERDYDDGLREGYENGWSDGYESGLIDGERITPTPTDLYPATLNAVLDRLVRHYRANLPHLAAALQEILNDPNHPSRVWDVPKGELTNV